MELSRKMLRRARAAITGDGASKRAVRRAERAAVILIRAILSPPPPPPPPPPPTAAPSTRTCIVRRDNGRYQAITPTGRIGFGKTAADAEYRATFMPQNRPLRGGR